MNLPIEFDSLVCGDLPEASTREWLETNGIGGFASSSILGLNTRRYHGLLTAATNPPVGRFVLLSKLEDAFILGGKRFDLSVNQYSDAIHPEGHLLLNSFRLDPFPVFNLPHRRPRDREIRSSWSTAKTSVVIQYELFGDTRWPLRHPRSPPADRLPRLPQHHAREQRDPPRGRDRDRHGNRDALRRPAQPALRAHRRLDRRPLASGFTTSNTTRERERGLDWLEDLYSPFLLRFNLRGKRRRRHHRVNPASRSRRGASPGRRRGGAAREDRERSAGRRRLRQTAHLGCRPFPGGARRPEDGHRRLSLVRRLGPRHHDLAARPHAGHRPLRRRAQHPASFRPQHGSRHAAESIPGIGRNTGVQHRRRHAVDVPRRVRISPLHTGLRFRARRTLPAPGRQHRLA